ncbi:hypothetical protein Dimus_000857, partial [Dionaea muscipula]
MMEKDTRARWENCIGCVLLPFSIGLRDDPLDYVREAKAIDDRKKHSLEAVCAFYISQILLNLFGAKVLMKQAGLRLEGNWIVTRVILIGDLAIHGSNLQQALVAATKAKSTLNILQEGKDKVQLVLMDTKLPDMDELKFIGIITKQYKLPVI